MGKNKHLSKTSIAFVCYRNQIRSVMAHGYLQHLVEKHTLQEQFYIDSFGTHALIDEEMDNNVLSWFSKHDIVFSHASQLWTPELIAGFDSVYTMAHQVHIDVISALSTSEQDKVTLFSNIIDDTTLSGYDIPDPSTFSGGYNGVGKLIKQGCENIFYEHQARADV